MTTIQGPQPPGDDEARVPNLAVLDADEDARRRAVEQPTDTGNAFRFARLCRARLRYIKSIDRWYTWDERRWALATVADLIKEGRAVQSDLAEHVLHVELEDRPRWHRWAGLSCGKDRIKAMIDLARGVEDLWIELSQFDADPYLVNFTNGTVDVRTGQLRAHDRDDFITKLVPHAYVPDATAPTYHRMISRTFQDACRTEPAETMRFIYKLLGYASLVGHNVEQIIIFIIGDENTGKSKVIETTAEVLGHDYAHKSRTDLIARKRGGHHDSERFSIIGKNLVAISETHSLFNLDESTVKELTGDRVIAARELYRAGEVNAPVTWTIVLASNDFPNVLEWDGAIRRRVIALPAGPTIPSHEVVKDIDERIITTEAEGVLAYLVAGAHQWYRDWQLSDRTPDAATTGLAPPLSVALFSEQYADSQDHIRRFIDECITLDPNCSVPMKQVHDAFRHWRGVGEVSNRNKLYARVRKLPGVTAHRSEFRGMCLRQPTTWAEVQTTASL